MKRFALILTLCLLFSCQKDDDGFRIYTVKAGHHYCFHDLTRTLNQHSLQGEFKINDTWEMEYTGGWNKIVGISEGSHKENSCRIVYRYENEQKMIGMYVYADGIRYELTIGEVQNGTYYFDMRHSGNLWYLTICGDTYTLPAGKKTDVGMVLYPYIGGDLTIGHDWIVPLKLI